MKRLQFLLLLPLVLFSSCSIKNKINDSTIVIGCSPTPHAEILKAAQPLLDKKGFDLKIKVIQDYVTPNTLLDSGDLDANYFQHVPYMNDFNEKNNTSIVSLVKVHFEPMGVYSKKHGSYSSTNDNGKIAIPNDVSNGKRARELLEISGIRGELIEMEAQAIPAALEDVDFGVINGNYALSAGITDKCLVSEPTNSIIANTNANVVAVTQKTFDANYKWTVALKDVMNSDEIREFVNTHFGSAVKAVF